MVVLIIGIAAFVSTILGGLFALRFQDRLHLITGFSAGAIIGVAFFDLLPESLELDGNLQGRSAISLMIGIGFLVYLLLDRLVIVSHHESDCENAHHKGTLGAGSLSLHSFLDGVMIGLAFQVSSSIGVIVTVAVLTHDFSDGINTVTLIVRGGGEKRSALKWLIIDALAPFFGIASTYFYTMPENTLGKLLGFFCGCFIFIGASDLLPESHHAHPKMLTTLMTFAGIVLIYVVIQIAKM